jgi:adenylate cyclase
LNFSINKLINNFTVGLILTAISFFIYLCDFKFFRLLDLKSYDTKVQLRKNRVTSNQIVIIAIDEKSLAEQGRWPWSRSLMAKLVNQLAKADVGVIGFDIIFPEKENTISFESAKRIIKNKKFSELKNKDNFLNILQNLKNADKKFSTAISNSKKTVLGYIIFPKLDLEKSSEKPIKRDFVKSLKGSEYSWVKTNVSKNDENVPIAKSLGISLSTFNTAANSLGFTSFIPEADGIVRQIPLIQRYQEVHYPALSLQMLKEFSKESLGISIDTFGVSNIQISDINIPTSENGSYLINYYGPAYTFKYISATDLLNGKIKPEELNKKIILVGTTAAAAHDLHSTPYGPLSSGVEVHANIIENVLNQDFLFKPNWIKIFDISLILLSGIFYSLVSLYLKAFGSFISLIFGLIGYISIDWYFFSNKGIVLNTIFPIFTQLFVCFGITVFRLFFEEKQKRFIYKAFSKYLSPVMVDQLVENPLLLKSGGTENFMTVAFSDLEGFTAVSEKLGPIGTTKIMNEYFTEMTSIILEEEGVVTQYAGDLIMSIYGAPIQKLDHAERAVTVGINMQRRLNEICEKWKKQGLPKLKLRIGINSDNMIFGNLGSEQIYYYSVIGDSVNLAARLESINKKYGTYLLISEGTLKTLPPKKFLTRIVDFIVVKGKSKPNKIYEVYGFQSEKFVQSESDYYENYKKGFKYYLEKKFQDSLTFFQIAQKARPDDKATLIMIERIQKIDANEILADWDGSYTMQTK